MELRRLVKKWIGLLCDSMGQIDKEVRKEVCSFTVKIRTERQTDRHIYIRTSMGGRHLCPLIKTHRLAPDTHSHTHLNELKALRQSRGNQLTHIHTQKKYQVFE